MREREFLLVGLVAVCVVSTIALARLLIVLRIFRHRTRRRNSYSAVGQSTGQRSSDTINGGNGGSDDESSGFLIPSLVFHVLVFLCLVTEVPVYTVRYASTLHSSGVGRPLYALHLCSYLLLFCAFCVIVTLWTDLAVFEPNEWTALVDR